MNKRYKYPRTYHLPWSEGIKSDDKVLKNDKHFKGQLVVGTIKMDGENTTLYSDYLHARSIDSRNHPSRNYIKNFHATMKSFIPSDLRICGENMYAKHSIHYKNLADYFLMISIWRENLCLSWFETKNIGMELELYPVPLFYLGMYDKDAIHKKFLYYCDDSKDDVEGYVIRPYQEFYLEEHKYKVGKFVRKNHVQTDEHWMKSEIIKNELIDWTTQ